MLSIDDRHDDFDKEDKMNIAEVKEMECHRRQRRLRSAMLPTFDVEQGSFIPKQTSAKLLRNRQKSARTGLYNS